MKSPQNAHGWWQQGKSALQATPFAPPPAGATGGDGGQASFGLAGLTNGAASPPAMAPRAHAVHAAPATNGATRPVATPPPDADAPWRALAAQIGEEIAHPLTMALERVQHLISTGRIERDSLRALRDELDQARRVGMASQQIARFASGRVKQSHERVQLNQLVQNVLAHRARELQARGFDIRSVFKSAEVLIDPTLLFSYLNAMVDWAVEHTAGQIDLRVDLKTWPLHARILLEFEPRRAESGTGIVDERAAGLISLDNVTWELLQQHATAMRLVLSRETKAGRVRLSTEFPHTIDPSADDAQEAASPMEVDEGLSSNSKLLAGSHVLVVCARRDVRTEIREALRNMGMVVDFVGSVDEAIDFCADGLPHGIVVESIATGAKFTDFKTRLRSEVPDFPMVEITETGSDFEVSGVDGRDVGCVSRAAITRALGAALIFEMTKSM